MKWRLSKRCESIVDFFLYTRSCVVTNAGVDSIVSKLFARYCQCTVAYVARVCVQVRTPGRRDGSGQPDARARHHQRRSRLQRSHLEGHRGVTARLSRHLVRQSLARSLVTPSRYVTLLHFSYFPTIKTCCMYVLEVSCWSLCSNSRRERRYA